MDDESRGHQHREDGEGAAGQAVQALNCAMGWDETLGLDLLGG